MLKAMARVVEGMLEALADYTVCGVLTCDRLRRGGQESCEDVTKDHNAMCTPCKVFYGLRISADAMAHLE